VILSGGQDVSLSQGQNILRAPTIQYQQPDRDATTKIGNFHADGPGTLQYVPNPKKPDQVFTAAWKAQVELGRNSGQPVLTLTGRPQLIMTGMGELTADQVIVYLREVAAIADAEPAADASGQPPNREKVQVRPDRLDAIGQVEVNSPQLLARTRELKTTFHEESPLPSQVGVGSHGPADNHPADNSSRLNPAPGTNSPDAKTNQIAADEINLVVALRGTHPAPTNLVCNGHVAFRDVPKPGETEQLDVRGGQLVADQLDSAARMIIHGAAPNEPPGSQLTEFNAHGMTMHAADVQLDEAQNRLWVDGPGVATVTPTHDLMAKSSSAAPMPFDIHWQGGLNFDGRQVVFDRQITVVGADDRLWCDQLIGTLAAPIQFGQRVDPQTARLAEVECRGSVAIDHLTRDAAGNVTSHDRGQLNRLTINQLTNRISGDGPGVLRSTSSRDANQFNAIPAAAASAKQPAANSAQLHFLCVDFQRGLDGNVLTKEIAFHDRVRTIYGPVDAWEQELDVNHPETLPPDTITLSSDDLNVNEDPIAARNKVDTPGQGGGKL
jgi:hypothetical protein